jgi:putative cell wall-binding protein
VGTRWSIGASRAAAGVVAVACAVVVLGTAPAARSLPEAGAGAPRQQVAGAAVASEALTWVSSDPVAATVALSQLAAPDGAARVLVARRDQFADALAGGVLQGASGGGPSPLLLVDGQGPLDGRVAAEVARLGAREALVLGGPQAVADEVVGDLRGLGLQVDRVAGDSRLATAAAVARTATAGRPVEAVLLARAFGDGVDPTRAFADSLVAGALAAEAGWPVLLTGSDALADAAAEAIRELAPAEVVVVGGEAAVSADVAQAVAALGVPTRRLAGASRVETARALQAERQAQGGGAGSDAAVVLGATAPDAWVAGFASATLAATAGAPVLLSAGGLADPEAEVLAGTRPARLVCAGDVAACDRAADAAGLPAATPATTDPPPGGTLSPGGDVGVTAPADASSAEVDGSCVAEPGTEVPAGEQVAVAVTTTPSPLPCALVVRTVRADGTVETTAVELRLFVVFPPVLAGAEDHATHVIGNPWDYADAADVRLAPGITIQVRDPRVEGGVLRFGSDGGYVHLLWQGFPGAIPIHPDGAVTPIDGTRFDEVLVRVRSSAPSTAVLSSQLCLEPPGQCSTTATLPLAEGWQTLRFRPGWSGPVHGLRFGTNSATDLEVDWVRVVRSGGAQFGQVLGAEGPFTLVRGAPDGSGAPLLEGLDPVVSGTALDPAGVPAGTWTLVAPGGATTTFTVVEPPPVHLTDPDRTGGEDYATASSGDPWDLAQATDVAQVGGATDVVVADGRLTARNTSNDPFAAMRMGAVPLDPGRYHRVTVTFANEGPLDLSFGPGGGSHGRLVWRRGAAFSSGGEVVAYPEQRTYTFSTAGPEALEEGAPWLGSPIDQVRFDPNEDPGARRWELDELHLRADDASSGAFTVRVADLPTGGDAGLRGRLDVGLDTDRGGADGVLLAQGAELPTGGEAAVPISTCGVPPGTYWAYAVARRGPAVTTTYATGPLQVSAAGC